MIDTKPVLIHSSGFRMPAGSELYRCLDKDDLVSFQLEREKRLVCTNGMLWVTIQIDRTDYLLGTDKSLHVPGRETVVLEAREPSCFELD